ncbi:hypothetical protein PVAP13_1NG502819 [Panicum virgatum]|uniref:Uncharacterized protein n=1 Tax=Panicum virgatum TaxID=38727 RepID=A0A8T0X705_PANVG|nr:hypothetical protein PVAP13_1NG502819 [Panicum virgatum]KAG2654707.1 hypothetical protein PVAP13_1NG502819 [Panicum virgatum]
MCLPTRPAPRPRRPQGRRNGLRARRAGQPPCGAGSCPQGRGNGLRARRAPACGAPSTAGVPRGVGPRLDNRPPTASRTGKGLRTLQRLDDLLQIGRGARLAAGQAQLGAAASAREPNPRRLAPPGRFQRRPQRPTPHQRPDGTADSAPPPPPAAVSARRIALDLSKLNPVVLAVLNRSTTSWRSSMRSCRPTWAAAAAEARGSIHSPSQIQAFQCNRDPWTRGAWLRATWMECWKKNQVRQQHDRSEGGCD